MSNISPCEKGWYFKIVAFKDLTDADYHEWEQLVAESDGSTVFSHPALISVWLKTYKPLRCLKSFMVRAVSGDNVALLPMTVWRRNWKHLFKKMLIPIGYSDYDYHNPLFRTQPSPESLRNYWSGLESLLAENFRYDSLVIDGVTDSYANEDEKWHKDEICPMLRLDDIKDESALMAFFKTSLRGDIRRQMRRLEEIGPLSLKEYNSWEEIPAETFATFMAQHSKRWPKAYKAPKFHENLLRDGLKAGVVDFTVLCVGDEEIAWHLGFKYRGRYYYYMPAGNEAYFKYSPTKIHLFYLVRRAVESGYEVYDHLRGEETYKSGWSNDAQHVSHRII